MMKLEKKIIYFIFILIVLDLIILSFINRKSLCVQSQIINQVQWHTKSHLTDSENFLLTQDEDKDYEVYTCDSKKKVLYNEDYVQTLNQLNYHLGNLESKVGTLTEFKKVNLNVTLHIYKELKNFLKISANDIFISEDLILKKESQELSRALIKSWVAFYQKEQGLNFFRQEVIVDLLFRIFKITTDNEELLKWNKYVERTTYVSAGVSFASWCQSPLKQIEYDKLCSEAVLKIGPSNVFTSFSIVKWFSKVIYEAYLESSVEEQIYFYKAISQLIENLSTQVVSNQSDDLIDFNSISEQKKLANTEILNWVQQLEQLQLPLFANSLKQKRIQLEKYLNEKQLNLDFIFYQEKPFSKYQLDAFNYLAFQETDYNFIGKIPDGYWIWPFLGLHSESLFDINIAAKYVLLQSCNLPSVEGLLTFKKWTERVLWVQDCDLKDNHLALHGFLHKGIQYFSLDNPRIQFILFYLPSLEFLIQKNKNVAHSAFAFKSMKDNSLNKLAELTGWSTPLWNHRARAYEVKSTIGLVEWFKLNNDFWPEILIK